MARLICSKFEESLLYQMLMKITLCFQRGKSSWSLIEESYYCKYVFRILNKKIPFSSIHFYLSAIFLYCQQPSNIIAQRKFSPAKDPCSIVWEILWDDFCTMELMHGKKDNPKSPPSQLILYLQSRSLDVKENVRAVKCYPESHQALQVYSSIDHALSIYGPNASKVCFYPLRRASLNIRLYIH